MRYDRQDIIKILKSKELPLDLLYSIYSEECEKRNYKRHSQYNFQEAMQMFIRFTDLNEFLMKRFNINRIEDKQGNLIHIY